MNRLVIGLLFLWVARLSADDTAATTRAPDPPAAAVFPSPPADGKLREELISLSALNDSLRRREQEREALYTRMREAVDPLQREQLVPELNRLNLEIEDLSRRFQTLALRTDISLYQGETEQQFNLQSELEQLLEPLLAELKAATRDSREQGMLTKQLEVNQERAAVAREALKNLSRLESTEPDALLAARLRELRALWSDRLQDSLNQITVAEHQLRQREAAQTSVLERTRGMASGFVRTRGLNLLLGALAFAAVFLLMRGSYIGIRKMYPHRKKGRSFSSRLSSLIWSFLTVIAAIGAMLAAFNATGDWFLLSLTLLFLIGVIWAGMKTLPAFLEQIYLMLNMGTVRENERVLWEGLPWKVNAIGFRTELVNPLLNGGVILVPTKSLVGLVSRPAGDKEQWFPSKEQDWVLLSDGIYGRVSHQTPSSVQVVSPGGSQKVYPVRQFLELAPTVLSTGFRHRVRFGIDYRHQAAAVSEIPARMGARLKEVLTEKLGDSLKFVSVDLAEAAESSLVFEAVIDCGGEAASKWNWIPKWSQTALVALCQAEGWEIPFPQLTVHTRE